MFPKRIIAAAAAGILLLVLVIAFTVGRSDPEPSPGHKPHKIIIMPRPSRRVRKEEPKKIKKKEAEEAATEKKSEEATTEDLPVYTEEDFFEALAQMGRTVQGRGIPYSGSAGYKTLEGAQAFNCALFVSWTLQEMGLLPEGKTFWFNSNCHGSGYKYMKKHTEMFEIYHPCAPMVSVSMLKPGDICGFEINGYAPHTAVYAGRDKKGRMLWYSAGRTDFRKMKRKDFKPVRFRYYEQGNDYLYTIVRIKWDNTSKG